MAAKKYKKVWEDFPNLAILTKSSTPGKVQLTFSHVTVGNKSVGKSVVAFALAGDLSSPYGVSVNMDIASSADGDKIRLLITEVILCAAADNLLKSKKQQDWKPRNVVLLPPFLAESEILHG